jgi:hypothetical protein
MIRRLLLRGGLGLLALLIAAPGFAQNVGTLRGTVKDPSGAILPNASVSLVSESTKLTRRMVTDVKGGFFFAALDTGSYTLKVELAGFKTRETKGVRVSPSGTEGVDVTLDVGEKTEVIQVTAARDVISTETGAREGMISKENIENLAMMGRNPVELMRILPGVTYNTNDPGAMETVGKFDGAGSTNSYTINGMRGQNLMVTLDGSKLQDVGANNGVLIVPNNDMVSEVKVQYSNYAAEYGTSAVNIQAVTKGGAAEFHGTIYDYVRDYHFAANDFSRVQAGDKKPTSKFNYPGFNLSGPVLIPGTGFNSNRDKLFFFIGAELSRQQRDQGADLGVTPTLGMRNGLFNDYQSGQHLDMPTTVNIPGGFPGAGTPAPNNDLSPYMDPMGKTIYGLYPTPNYNDPNNRYNYIFNKLAGADRDQQFIRLDYNISDATRLYVRLARDADSTENPRGLWWNSSGVELPTPVSNVSVGKSAVANLTSILSPTVTNEMVVSWSQLKNDLGWKDPSKMELATYGLQDSFADPFGSAKFLPQIVVDYSQAASGRGSMWSANDVDKIFSYNGFLALSDSLTKVFDTHAVKVGINVERQYKQQNFNHDSNVELDFSSWANGSTGNALADVLVGRPAQAVTGTPSAIGTFVAWNFEGFIQDSWKIRKNFTLEYGVRLARWTNNYEEADQGAIFLPQRYDATQGFFLNPEVQQSAPQNLRVNGLAYARFGDVSRDLHGSRPFLIMPRVNFAWDVSGTGSTVIRGGVGFFYNREQGNVQYGTINLPPNAFAANINSYDVPGGLCYGCVSRVNPWTRLGGSDISTEDPNNLQWPRNITASFSIAKRLAGHHVLELGYVGTWGRHLTAQEYINVIPPGRLLSGTIGNSDMSVPVNRVALSDAARDAQRLYPTAPNVTYNSMIGVSNYNSFQATLSRNTGRFQYMVSYTFSKALGTLGGDLARVDPFEPNTRTYGTLPTDRTHVANASWTWSLGDPAKGFLGVLANGWHLSGVSSWYSGTPLSSSNDGFAHITFQGDLNAPQATRTWWGSPNYATGVMPTFSCDPRKSGTAVGDKILDVNCFGIPSYPDSGPFVQPYYMRAPARMNHDVSVFKNFTLKGDTKLQLRVGAFNVFNQAYPNANDIDLRLEANCNVHASHVPNGSGGYSDNVCDPLGGYSLTQNTKDNFGKIITKRGHRVVEFALKLFF